MNDNTIYIPTSSSSGYCFFCKGWWIWTNQLRCIDYRPPRFLLTTVDGSEILLSPVEVGSLSHDTGFIHPRWFRIPLSTVWVYWLAANLQCGAPNCCNFLLVTTRGTVRSTGFICICHPYSVGARPPKKLPGQG